jgi:hypothetical protein
MSSSKGTPAPQPLPTPLNTNLSAYSLAAAAAGVGLLAMAQPAAAEIVYTPTNTDLGPGVILTLDLNHDGVNDIEFIHYAGAYRGWTQSLRVFPYNSGAVGAVPTGFAAALAKGARIGPAQAFGGPGIAMLETGGYCCAAPGYARHAIGPWVNKENEYLAVRFNFGGGVHYGWIKMSVTLGDEEFGATINGYAYETVIGKPIAAGELSEKSEVMPESAPFAQPSLGMLAVGAPAMNLWRRENDALAKQ